MSLAYHTIIAIVQLVFFVPGFGLAILLGLRHGFKKSAGWYFLIMFCLVRTVGAICEIIAEQAQSRNAFIAAVVCNSIGLAPLTLLCLGMLSRVNLNSTNPIPSKTFKYISLLSFIGLILAILGGSRQNGQGLVIRPETQAGICIFIVVYVSTVAILAILCTRISSVVPEEKRLLLAVLLSVPFIAVRLVYAIVADFGNHPAFHLVNGNTTIYLCMGVATELIVTVIVILFSMTLRVLPKEMSQNSDSQEGVELESGKPRKHVHKAKGPISWVYYSIKDAREARESRETERV